jgi:hypothetical protein
MRRESIVESYANAGNRYFFVLKYIMYGNRYVTMVTDMHPSKYKKDENRRTVSRT